MRTRARPIWVVTASMLALLQAGCFGLSSNGDLHPAYVAAVSLPDSVSGHDPIPVSVYTFHSDCTVRTAPSTFVALNDSTFELRLLQTPGTPGVGCPGGIWAHQFQLGHPPSGRFHIRFVGANTVEAIVNGGTEPALAVREVFRFRGHFGVPSDSLSVVLVGCQSESTGYPVCIDTLAVVGADLDGIAVFEESCAVGGIRYRAEAQYPFYGERATLLEFEGQLHCKLPWQTIIQGSD